MVLACLITLAVFSPARQNQFVLIDDNVHIQENPLLNPPTWEKLKFIWTHPVLGLFVPVTYTGWAAQALLAKDPAKEGLKPQTFHKVSLLLHAANVSLAFAIVYTLYGHPLWAFLAALIFGIHPLQTEVVSWVSAQKDLFAGLFGLLALWLYLIWAKRDRLLAYAAAFVSFLLSVLAKPSSVTLGLMAMALDVGILGRPWKRSLKALWPWFVIGLPILGITKMLQPDEHIGQVPEWYLRPIIALDTIAFYLSKVFLPWGLTPDYSRTPQALLHHPAVYYSWIVPVFLFFLLKRRLPNAFSLSVFFVAGILPVLGFLPFYFQVFSTVADRYTYLSLLAWGLLLLQLVRHYPFTAVKATLTLLLFFYAMLSHQQTKQWKTSWHLFTHTLIVNPGSLLAHNNLGTLFEEIGRYDDAYFHYEQSTKLAPQSPAPWFNLARIHAMRGEFWKAKVLFQKVLTLAPDVADAHYSLGVMARREGQWTLARQHLRRAAMLQPQNKKMTEQLSLLDKEWKVEKESLRAKAAVSQLEP